MKKVIILAAGKSTRTAPLTLNTPKPLLKILDQTILERTLSSLAGRVDEIIIVVGYHKEQVMKKIGNCYKKTKIRYVFQTQQSGTGDALMSCHKHIKESDELLILGGDDLYSEIDLKNMLGQNNSILVTRVDSPEEFGIVTKNKEGMMQDLIEKPKTQLGNLANTGCYAVTGKIIDCLKNLTLSKRGEFELTDAIIDYSKIPGSKMKVMEIIDYWFPIAYPWNYLEANVFMLKRPQKKVIDGIVEKGVTIKGNIHLGTGSIIASGSYIEGPVFIGEKCIIGPAAYIRKDTVIMDRCHIRGEIFDSVIMNGTTAKHNCYIGHSVIGENVNIAAGTITADYRHDSKNHITLINNNKIDTKRKKLGTFIGDDVKTGIGTLIYPGRKIWPSNTTLPGEIVTKDKTGI